MLNLFLCCINKTPEQAKTPPGRKKQQDKNLQDALRFGGEHLVFLS